jgi:hypothetical protein
MKVCYYYQTFVGLHQILKQAQEVSLVIVSSLHFDEGHIYLNDNEPTDPLFDPMWTEIQEAHYEGTEIHLMLGGAGGAYQELFTHFDLYYPLLVQMIRDRPYVQGINLDIEEEVRLADVKHLIRRIKTDCGSDFKITMAPVQESLMTDGPGMGGFSYKELVKSAEGPWIDAFNVQCYGSFSYDTIHTIVQNGYPPETLVMGMMSGQFTKETFPQALHEVQKIVDAYPSFRGVYDWEYYDAPPGGPADPSVFAREFAKIQPTSSDT